jgi:hypothetical protein
MKLRLIVFLAVAFGCVGLLCPAVTNDVASQPSATIATNGSASPATAVALRALGNSPPAMRDDLLLAGERSSISKLFRSSGANYDCPVNQQCGTGCCTTSEQCCFNSATGGHYCAAKCSN